MEFVGTEGHLSSRLTCFERVWVAHDQCLLCFSAAAMYMLGALLWAEVLASTLGRICADQRQSAANAALWYLQALLGRALLQWSQRFCCFASRGIWAALALRSPDADLNCRTVCRGWHMPTPAGPRAHAEVSDTEA